MSRRGHGTEAFGGSPVGDRVALPAAAREPIRVYVNGVEQTRGEDYDIKGSRIVFREPIYKEQLRHLSPLRKIGLGLGLFGWYERNEVVDVEYGSPAGTKLMSDATVMPADRQEPAGRRG
jgi:hypothetical protein